ncbi:MAG: fibronectin type III domain-containing protein [Atopobiaceae bacterium]|nr:fibronectin type III domain-containing protein [Atopobiaceae bacterium]
MGTTQTFTSGGYTILLDWREVVTDTAVNYYPRITATSTTRYEDPYFTGTWRFYVDGTQVENGYSDDVSYYGYSGTLDTFSAERYVTREYGTAHTLRLVEVFNDLYGASGKKATVDSTLQIAARPYALPAVPTNITAIRQSNDSVSLSWTNNGTGGATTSAPYESILVERQTNGGSWAQIASLGGQSTGYTDNATAQDCAYSYRVRAYNSSGYGAYTSPTQVLYTTPIAPGTPTASKQDGTTALVSWTNPSATATSTVIQRREDGGAWADYAAVSLPATDYTDTSATGHTTLEYRVANEAGGIRSAYSVESNAIIALQPPAAPTILTPANQAAAAGGSVELSWRHNPVDGSVQTKYQIAYGTDPEAMTTLQAQTSSASTYQLSLSGFSVGDLLYWKVRTWGLHEDASEWSGLGSIKIASPITLAITDPSSDPYSLTGLPFTIEWSFSAGSDIQSSVTVEIADQSDIVVASKTIYGTDATMTLESWQPENQQDYSLTLTAKSSSTLVESVSLEIRVDYAAPALPSCDITEGEGKSVSIVVHEGEATGSELPTASLSLVRVVDGVETELATGLHDGGSVIDRTPVMDKTIVYRVMALSSQNLSSKRDVTYTLDSGGWFVWNYGDGNSLFAHLRANLTMSVEYADDSELWYGAGAEDPIVLTGSRKSKHITVAGEALGGDVEDFETFADSWHRPCIFRGPRGRIGKVKANITQSNAHDKGSQFTVDMWRLA